MKVKKLNSNEMAIIASNPIFFQRNRVFRVYKGGMLFNDFFGDVREDGNTPEEWVASNVKAMNKINRDPFEGISKIEGTELYFDELIREQKELMIGNYEKVGVLVKVLDSSVRLPIQAHPDKEFSKIHFSSEYGKAEAWLILATRENARVYFGFSSEITEEIFIKAIDKSETEKNAMEELLNAIPVQKGDIFLVPAKVAHAIGYGCMILEIQEPTDFTIQPEAWCGDYKLSEYEKYLGLDKKTALQCFDYSMFGDRAISAGRKTPKMISKTDTITNELLIGPKDTLCFSLNRYRLHNDHLVLPNAPAVYIVTEGYGYIEKPGYSHKIQKGDYFFLPFSVKNKCNVRTDGEIELVECLPPNNLIQH
jgi:mannose-6-phosphate isomerase